MKDPLDTVTNELPLEAPKRRGRPPRGDRTMTPAERQKAYRRRSSNGSLELDYAELTRPQLLGKLGRWMVRHDEAITSLIATGDETQALRDVALAQSAIRSVLTEIERRFLLS